jgi:hypothetical protein
MKNAFLVLTNFSEIRKNFVTGSCVLIAQHSKNASSMYAASKILQISGVFLPYRFAQLKINILLFSNLKRIKKCTRVLLSVVCAGSV